MDRIKAVWESDKTMIITGAALLLIPSVISIRGRLRNIMQLGGFGILAWTVYKNKDVLFG